MFSIPPIVRMAHKKNLFDIPNIRTIHQLLTPRLGGLAIFAAFISSVTIFGKLEYDSQRLIAGCIILFFIGLKDDIEAVSAFKKFFVQVLSTSIILFMGDMKINSLCGFLGVYKLDEGLSYLLTAFVIIGLTNSINLIDGLDGLAGSIVFLSSLSYTVIFFILSEFSFNSDAILAAALCGSILGFLRYNFTKALIFMGDSGSLICGFVLSFLTIKCLNNSIIQSQKFISIPIAIMYIPVFDTLRVFLIRLFSGTSPFTPDKNHIHHVLLRFGFSQLQTVCIIVILYIIVLSIGFLLVKCDINFVLLIYTLLSIMLGIVLYFLNKKC
jgi:UDP-N-acetylmuramyl pentapeptide phosphotransferase/UDP-N-acetylglucosamine-1-phosphate transferase